MNKIFAIIGGDKRQVLLAEKLTKEGKVEIYGLDKQVPNTDSLENVIKNSDVVISAIPFTRDNIHINMPLSNEKIKIETFRNLTKNKIIFTGNEFLENEEYNILNAELTSEAILSILIKDLHIPILNSNILILGYGRIGSILLKYIKALQGNVYCTYNNDKEKALITINNCIPISFKNLKDFLKLNHIEENIVYENRKIDCIINTIPDIVLNEESITFIEDKYILDIASKPCLDIKNLKDKSTYIQSLGLPGKYFPKTSSDIMKDIVLKNIK